MKIFLVKICLFALVGLAGFVPLDNYMSSRLAKDSWYCFGETRTWHKILEGEVDSELYIYGSSRAWNHINPAILADTLGVSCYNFGVDGHNFDIQHLRHQLLLKYTGQPRYIIHSLDGFTLRKRPDLYLRDQFLPFMLRYREFMPVMLTFKGFHWTDFYVPLLRYHERRKALKQVVKNWDVKNFPDPRKNGFKYYPDTELEVKEDKLTQYPIPQNDSIIAEYEGFIKDCIDRNIELILVYTPEFHIHQKYVSNRAEILGTFSRLAEKYNLAFFDYSSDSLCYDTRNFYNYLHLNETGARQFSQSFAHDIKSIVKNK